MSNQAKIIRAADQQDIWLLTDHMKPLLGGHDTNDELAITLTRLHPGGGPRPHVHSNEDEMFYVLEGEVTFLSGDRLIRAPAGSFVNAPRNIVHCFKCTSATPAAMLLFVTPAKFMSFAMTLAVPASDFLQVPQMTPDVIGRLMSVAPQFGISMLPDHVLPTTLTDAPPASKKLWVMGEHVSYLATSKQTNGRFTVVDLLTAPGGGPMPHAHHREDELFYVVAGRHEVTLGDQTSVADVGDLVFIPRGTRHRYTNLSEKPGHLLSVHTPGGFETFFDEVGVDAIEHAVPPKMPAMPPEAIAELLARHGMTN